MLGDRQATLVRLAVYLGGLAVLVATAGIVLLVNSASDHPLREVGKWLSQVALVFLGTGVVTILVRQSELSRAQRDAWADSLHDLIGAHDEAQTAARLLSAHATAKTYADQIMVLVAARGTLRRLASSLEDRDDEVLHAALYAMRRYLKDIIKEYQANYLRVARQQLLDEAVLDVRLKKIAESNDPVFPVLPSELAGRLPAGRDLEDVQQFPKLNEFRTDFKSSDFRAAYETVKPIMQYRAGILVTRRRNSAPPIIGTPSEAGPS